MIRRATILAFAIGVTFSIPGWVVSSFQVSMPSELTVTDFNPIPGLTGNVLLSVPGSVGHTLYMVNLTTGESKVILDEKRFGGMTLDVAISPDGSKMAFFDAKEYLSVLYTHTGLIEIWADTAQGNAKRYLNWSPTGDRLAFVSDRDLYVINEDGTGLRKMKQHFWHMPYDFWLGRNVLEHDQIRRTIWMPDGSGIIYDDYPTPTVTPGADRISPECRGIFKVNSASQWVLEDHSLAGGFCNGNILALHYREKYPELRLVDLDGSILQEVDPLCERYPDSTLSLSPHCRYLAYGRRYWSSAYGLRFLDVDSFEKIDFISGILKVKPSDSAWSPDDSYFGLWNPDDSSFNVISLPGGDRFQIFRLSGAPDEVYISGWALMDIYPADPLPEPTHPLTDAIVFVSSLHSESYDVFVQRIDGSGLRNLTSNDYWEGWPVASPDGKQIAYQVTHGSLYDPKQLWVMDSNGADQIRLTGDDTKVHEPPQWSPDGRKISFVGWHSPESILGLYFINADGTGQQLLVEKPEDPTGYSWTPDSSGIAFGGRDSIIIAYTDGRPETVLDANCGYYLIPASDPAWSPDGNRITHVCSEQLTDSLRVMDSDGSNESTLVYSLISLPGSFCWRIYNPQWSHDCSQLAFVANVGFTKPYKYEKRVADSCGYLYVIDSDGSNLRRLASKVEHRFFWDPDGDWILFQGRGNGIYVAHSSGTGLTRVADGIHPAWLPENGSLPVSSELQLHRGWNCISLCLDTGDYDLSSFLTPIAANCTSVWAYYSNSGWKRHIAGADGSLNDLDTIEPKRGYMFHMAADDKVELTGFQIANKTVGLRQGWNLVGYSSLIPQSVEEALSSLPNSTYVYTYDNSSETWLGYVVGDGLSGNTLSLMEPGCGYWVYVERDCDWVLLR